MNRDLAKQMFLACVTCPQCKSKFLEEGVTLQRQITNRPATEQIGEKWLFKAHA